MYHEARATETNELPQNNTPEEIFRSEGTLQWLRDAIDGSLHDILLSDERGKDMANVFETAAVEVGKRRKRALSDEEKQRFWWHVMAEGVERRVFPELLGRVVRALERSAYDEIRRSIQSTLDIRRISSSLWNAQSLRPDKFHALERRFMDFLEVSGLPAEDLSRLNPESPETRARRIVQHAARMPQKARKGMKGEEEEGELLFVPEPKWPVPSLKDLQPGYILESKNNKTGVTFTYELLSEPYQTPEGYWRVKTRAWPDGTGEENLSLPDMGVAAYQGDVWHPDVQPIWLLPKEKYTQLVSASPVGTEERDLEHLPGYEDLQPGRIVEVEARTRNGARTLWKYEILGPPRQNADHHWMMRVKPLPDGSPADLSLTYLGLIPYSDTDSSKQRWHPVNRFVRLS